MSVARPVMTPFWLGLWACALALGWLLPNHYLPWLSFQADAWVAGVLLLAVGAIILRSRGPVAWHGIAVLAALLLLTPWLQYGAGKVLMAGTAWITSIYLLGLLLALLAGAHWESNSPGQLADGLFLAIGLAAVLSVGLQLQQWLGLDGLELWTMGGGGERPHANFGQPNQLGTFLLWGLLAAFWGVLRGRIGGRTALLLAVYLLFGLALTRSRTAWIAIVMLVAASWLWRRLWPNPKLPWIVTGLGLYFLACVLGLGWFQQVAQGAVGDYTRMSNEVRPLVWAAFLDAAWQQPLWGYGWGQVVLAQMAVAADHPYLQGVFLYSHNLFLDLLLWCGIPLGVFVSVALLVWFWRRLRAVNSAENAVLLLLLLVVANHALLELPLHHAYFLLPVGMVMGVLNTRLKVRPLTQTGRWSLVVLSLAGMTLLTLVVRDYARAEQSYQDLRMEWGGIKLKAPASPPDVLLLTQWRDCIRYARFEPRAGLDPQTLEWMRHVTGMFPNVVFMNKLAMALAMNQQADEAQLWLKRMCKVVPEAACLAAKAAWNRQGLSHPEIAAIPWPVKDED
jgi:O-antigen ligase